MDESEKFVIKKRKYVGEKISVAARVPRRIYNQLESTARKTGYNRSEIVIMCLEYALKNLNLELDNEE